MIHNYMALDLSLNGTGVAIATREILHKRALYLINTKKISDHMEKICYIKKRIFKLIKKCHIEKVFIEGQSFASRGRGTLSIAQLHGVIYYSLLKKQIPYECIPPTTVKKFVCGKGNCKKSLILKSLYKRYSIDIDQEDLADSVAILITGMKIDGVRRNKRG